MKEKLEQYLDELILLLKDGGAFALEQLPIFVQEYLTYYTWFHGIASLMLPLAVIILYILYRLYKTGYIRKMEGEPIVIIPVLMSFGSSLLIVFGTYHAMQFIKVVVAPRVYLIENLTNLL